MSMETAQALTLENLTQDFDLALKGEDQQTAVATIHRMRKLEYADLADEWETTLMEKNWYCDICQGMKIINEGELDNLIEKECLCQKLNKVL